MFYCCHYKPLFDCGFYVLLEFRMLLVLLSLRTVSRYNDGLLFDYGFCPFTRGHLKLRRDTVWLLAFDSLGIVEHLV